MLLNRSNANVRYLLQHVALNRLENCSVLVTAASDTDGMLKFSAASWESSMGRLSAEGELEVPSVTLDPCVYGERRLRPPNVMKIDAPTACWPKD